jgi:hypothetical protein
VQVKLNKLDDVTASVNLSAERAWVLPAVRVGWMEPEGPHSVENIDERRYHAIRVELK